MATTYTNMVLKSWNASTDNFAFADLDANWSKIDVHDHSTNKGVQIPAAGIVNGAITNGKLAANAVTSDKITDNHVTSAKINSGAVTSAKVADAAITSRLFNPTRGSLAIASIATMTNNAWTALPESLAITPLVASTLLISAQFPLSCNSGAGASCQTQFRLKDNGTVVSTGSYFGTGETSTIVHGSALILDHISLTAAAHTLTIEYYVSSASGTSTLQINGRMNYLLVAS